MLRFPKLAKWRSVIPADLNTNCFLNSEVKKFFEKLKNVFCKKHVLQHFHLSKAIRWETDASENATEDVWSKQDSDKNWHLVAFFLRKILPAKKNYKTHDAKLWVIIICFKLGQHSLKEATRTISHIIDHKNPGKFMEITCLSIWHIWFIQKLLRYNFKIDYQTVNKNQADTLSQLLTD